MKGIGKLMKIVALSLLVSGGLFSGSVLAFPGSHHNFSSPNFMTLSPLKRTIPGKTDIKDLTQAVNSGLLKVEAEKNQITIQVSQEYNADAPRHKRRTIDMGYHKVCFLTAASPWGDDGNDCHLYTDKAPDGKAKVHWWITAWNEDDPIVRCRARCLDW